MSDTVQIIVGVLFLVGVYILTQMVVGWRIRRAGKGILKDLEGKMAFDAASAADLPYSKPHLFRIGLRDFRPKALDALAQAEFLGKTHDGKFYLKKRLHELNL
jgi:hypothetical protein